MGRDERLNPVGPGRLIDPNEALVRDAKGRVLKVGDEVLMNHVPPIFQIVKIDRAPDGPAMVLELVARIRFTGPRGLPSQDLVRVVDVDEKAPRIDLTTQS